MAFTLLEYFKSRERPLSYHIHYCVTRQINLKDNLIAQFWASNFFYEVVVCLL